MSTKMTAISCKWHFWTINPYDGQRPEEGKLKERKGHTEEMQQL